MNYFSLFSLPLDFSIDEAALKRQYFALQREFHPDKMGLAGAQKSMELNQAYQVLTHPLKRAQHFLALHGVDVGHDDSVVKPDMSLLEEMMEKREAVMELESTEAAESLLASAKQEYEVELVRFTELAADLEGEPVGERAISPRSGVPSESAQGSCPSGQKAFTGTQQSIPQSLLRLQYLAKWQGEIKQQMTRLT